MATTWNAIYLGKLTTYMDPTEGNTTTENAGASGPNGFLNRDFGSATSPLYDQIYSVQAVNNSAPNDSMNNNNSAGTPDQIRVDLDGNGTLETYTYDAVTSYSATVTSMTARPRT